METLDKKDVMHMTAVPTKGESDNGSENGDTVDDLNEEEEATNKIFNVREAVPPCDYDAPYSQLPGNVVLNRVK